MGLTQGKGRGEMKTEERGDKEDGNRNKREVRDIECEKREDKKRLSNLDFVNIGVLG